MVHSFLYKDELNPGCEITLQYQYFAMPRSSRMDSSLTQPWKAGTVNLIRSGKITEQAEEWTQQRLLN